MGSNELAFDEYGIATTRVTPLLFGVPIEVTLYPDLDGDDVVTERMLAALDDLRQLDAEHRAAIAEMLWEQAERCIEATDYGFPERAGETHEETCRREFGVHSAADAFAAAGLPTAQVSGEHDALRGRFAVLQFYPPWEDEHGCAIVLRDGQPVGWGEAGVYVAEFDEP